MIFFLVFPVAKFASSAMGLKERLMYSKIGLAGILLLAVLVSGAAAVDNMLENSDFQNGTEGYSFGTDYGEFALDPSVPGIVGSTALARVDSVGANAWEPELHSPPFDLEQGKTYTYSFWAKTEPGVTRDLSCSFEQLDIWVGIGETITINDQWQEYHYTGEWVEPGSPPQVVIHVGFEFLLDDVWFSHFLVYEGDYVEEELASVTPMDSSATSWGKIKSR